MHIGAKAASESKEHPSLLPLLLQQMVQELS